MNFFNINLCLNEKIKNLTLSGQKSSNEVKLVNYEINKDIIKNQKTHTNKRRKLTINELKKIVLTIPFTPAIFTEKRLKENWQSQQVIALDFDDVNYDEVLNRAKKLNDLVSINGFNFYPNLIYSTISDDENDTDKRRFRLIYILDKAIEDNIIMINTLNSLNHYIFEGLADSAIGIHSVIYPGKSILFENNVINDSEVCFALHSEFCENNKTSNTIDFKGEMNYLEDLEGPIRIANSVKKTRDKLIKDFEIFKIFFSRDVLYRFHYDPVMLAVFSNLRLIKGGQKLYKDQIEYVNKNGGGIDVKYNFKTKAFDFGNKKTFYEPYHLKLKLSKNIQPYSLNTGNFTPYITDPKNVVVKYFKHTSNTEKKDIKYYNKKSISDFLSTSLNKIVNGSDLYIKSELKNKEYFISTTDFKDDNYEHFNTATEIINDKINYKINLVKLYTGAGKTHTMEKVSNDFIYKNREQTIEDLFNLDQMEIFSDDNDEGNLLICFSNHKLKEEFYESYQQRFKDENKILYTPNYIFETEELNDYLDSLTENNLYEERMSIIKDISENKEIIFQNEVIHYTENDCRMALKYINVNTQCKELKRGVILTTHHRGIIDGSLKAKSIVFDEDPYNVFSSTKEYKPDLTFLKKTEFSHFIMKYVNNEGELILNYNDEYLYYKKEPLRLPDDFVNFCISEKRLDVINFGKSEYYLKSASDSTKSYLYYSKTSLRNVNITVLSATLNDKVYELMFPDRKINFFNYSICKIKGSLSNIESNQSFSKTFFTNVEIKLKDKELKGYTPQEQYKINLAYSQYVHLLTEVGDKPVITYKRYMHLFPGNLLSDGSVNPDIPYLGNCSGYNALSGKDIAIVGRIMIPPHLIVLEALGLGIDVKDIDLSKSNRNGVETDLAFIKHYTFNNDSLRILDMFYTETENTQAIGRARLNREATGNIDLYSPIYFPIRNENE